MLKRDENAGNYLYSLYDHVKKMACTLQEFVSNKKGEEKKSTNSRFQQRLDLQEKSKLCLQILERIMSVFRNGLVIYNADES